MNQKLNRNSVQRFNGLSTDTKPTTCNNGSIFVEIDTGKKYIFNKADGTWTEIPSSGSSETNNYNSLVNKPTINGVTVQGDLTSSDLHINGVGKDVAGTEYVIDGQTITAKSGAEIFNSYYGASANKAAGTSAHAEGISTVAKGDASHSEGVATSATASNSHAEGAVSKATGSASHAEGNATTASGVAAHTEGGGTTASGAQSHAEGISTVASEAGAHAEGNAANASGAASHAEGYGTQASGVDSHAEGSWCIASGLCAHAEGSGTEASGNHSHAEGTDTEASGLVSHAEGEECKAIGLRSHAEGQMTQAIGMNSHAEGEGTIANTNQHVEGKYNVQDSVNKFAHIIGNGSGAAAADRHNAYAIDWAGKIYVNGAEEGVDVSVLDTEVDVVANAGAKNLFNIASPDAIDYKTVHNILDDTITIAGSAGFSRYVVPVSLKAGSYIFTANVNSISTSGRIRFNTASDGTGTNVTSQIDFSQAGSISREFTIAQDTAFFVMIYSSTSSADTSSSLVISQCMIRSAAITDSTFQPYALPNTALTPAAIKAVDEGAKNALPITGSTSEVSGITFTVNADGTITSSGTLESGSSNAVFECSNFQLPAGTYTYTCEGAAQQTVRDSYVQKYNGSSWDAVARDYENNTFTLTQTEQIRVRLRVYATGTSGTFKPMICTASDWAVSQKFVPYCPTNRELYESKADVSQVFGRGIALKTTDDCDNITDVGMYYALSSATVPAANAPFSTSGFRLRVESWYQSMSGVVSIIQIADKYSSSEYVEKRRIYFYTSNIGWRWTDWTTTINVSMTVPADRSLQSESLTKGATEMSGAEQDETENTEAER